MSISNNNTGLTKKQAKPVDVESRMIARLPKDIRHWLMYNAVANFHITSIAKLVKDNGAKKAMEIINKKQAELMF